MKSRNRRSNNFSHIEIPEVKFSKLGTYSVNFIQPPRVLDRAKFRSLRDNITIRVNVAYSPCILTLISNTHLSYLALAFPLNYFRFACLSWIATQRRSSGNSAHLQANTPVYVAIKSSSRPAHRNRINFMAHYRRCLLGIGIFQLAMANSKKMKATSKMSFHIKYQVMATNFAMSKQ